MNPERTILFVEQLTNIDFAYLDPERGLVGETWLMDVELGGALDSQGMVFDFGHVKREIKALVDASYDHAVIVPKVAAGIEIADDEGQRTITLPLPDGRLELVSPADAVSVLSAPSITESRLAAALEADIRSVVPSNVDTIAVRLRPESIDGAYYHYCHGLRMHTGNCQRIAHGHRSRIQVWRGGSRDAELEGAWARRWTDIFLATEHDQLRAHQPGHLRFGYDAPQGRFELELPQTRVDVLNTETTVELLAQHMAASLAEDRQLAVRVRAFEGVGKGAIAEALGAG